MLYNVVMQLLGGAPVFRGIIGRSLRMASFMVTVTMGLDIPLHTL